MRTENEIFKEFENLDYRIEKNKTKFADSENSISLIREFELPNNDIKLAKEICIDLTYQIYNCFEIYCGCPLHLSMYEHKLLTELFTIWGWL